MAYQPDLDRLLTPGTTYVDSIAEYRIEPHRLDDVVLQTGAVVACDPLVFAETEPFETRVEPGRYPLVAWVAVLFKQGVEDQRRNAALQLVVRDEPVARWELALQSGQDPSELGEKEYFGFAVDAGCGVLADRATTAAVEEWDEDRVDEVLIPADYPLRPVPGLVSAVVDEATGGNLVLVTSGWGDGVYATFLGRTAGGEVASFVIDFGVVPLEEDAAPEVAGAGDVTADASPNGSGDVPEGGPATAQESGRSWLRPSTWRRPR